MLGLGFWLVVNDIYYLQFVTNSRVEVMLWARGCDHCFLLFVVSIVDPKSVERGRCFAVFVVLLLDVSDSEVVIGEVIWLILWLH